MVYFERAQNAFNNHHYSHGLLWLVECWRSAARADDRSWQRLAQANLSLWRYQTPELRGVISHHETISCAAFSPDGSAIITGSADGIARVSSADTGQPIGAPLRHQAGIVSVAFSRSGERAVTTSKDKSAKLWDALTGQAIGEPLRFPGQGLCAVFSPDGTTMFTLCERPGSAAPGFNQSTGRGTGKDMIRTMAFSPNGKQLITGGLFPFARLWDVSSPTPTWKNLVASRYAPSARLSQSTTDGKTIQTFPVAGAAAWMWDAASGKQVGLPLLHRGRVLAVAFSPDGKSVLTARPMEVQDCGMPPLSRVKENLSSIRIRFCA